MILLIVFILLSYYSMDDYVDPNIFESYLIKANGMVDTRVVNIIWLCEQANRINFFKSH